MTDAQPTTIQTTLATSYAVRMIALSVVCLVLGLWGVYDLFFKIPGHQRKFDDYTSLTAQRDQFEQQFESDRQQGRQPTQDDVANLNRVREEITAMAPDGAAPVEPGKFDKITQWAYISLLPCAPIFLMMHVRTKKLVYRMDPDDTLHLPAEGDRPTATWTAAEVKDIDMSRWMAKSVATVEHVNGTQVKLDAYHHRDLHLIIGRIAHRFYPDKWEIDGTMVKAESTLAATSPPGDTSA